MPFTAAVSQRAYEDLVRADGQYARLFNLQASGYR